MYISAFIREPRVSSQTVTRRRTGLLSVFGMVNGMAYMLYISGHFGVVLASVRTRLVVASCRVATIWRAFLFCSADYCGSHGTEVYRRVI